MVTWIYYDSFNRIDSATLGNLEIPITKAWNDAGTIVNNTAQLVSTGLQTGITLNNYQNILSTRYTLETSLKNTLTNDDLYFGFYYYGDRKGEIRFENTGKIMYFDGVSTIDSGYTHSAGTYNKYLIDLDSTNGNVIYYLNGIQIGTGTYDLSTSPFRMSITKYIAGTTNIDYIGIYNGAADIGCRQLECSLNVT